MNLLESLHRDVRQALRVLAGKPGFTAVAVLTLGLGIGAATTIFSVVNGVLLKSLPYPNPERLVVLSESSKQVPSIPVAYPDFLDWQSQQTVFEDLAARMPVGYALTGAGEPERVAGRRVTASFFRTLGVQPAIGRSFTDAEDAPGGERVVILSHELWQRRFDADPNLIGRGIQLNSESWTVIGVLPANFDFYGQLNGNNEFFVPIGSLALQEYMQNRAAHPGIWVIGRLKPGETIEEARSEMSAIAQRLEQEYPASNAGTGVVLSSFVDDYLGDARPGLLLITAAVALVLLISCANVANLQLARASGRQKEIAVRLALGAGRARILRQLLTESLLLAIGGGLLGCLLSAWGSDLLINLNPDSLPRLDEVQMDLRVLCVALVVTLFTGILSGLAPALQSSRPDLISALKQSGRHSSVGVGARRLRSALVVSEIALSLMLIVGAGLLLRSFGRLMQVDPGFDAENVLTIRLRLPDAKYRDSSQTMGFARETLRRVSALPGVRHASLSSGFPLGNEGENEYMVEGEPAALPGQAAIALSEFVSEDYHRALGIELVAGRYFNEHDTAESPLVAIVDTDFVGRHFHELSPAEVIGKRLRMSEGKWRQVVGVVKHVRHSGLDEEARVEIYRPYTQIDPKWLADFTRALDLVVKTSSDPTGFVAPIKGEIQAIDKDQPLANVMTLAWKLNEYLAPRRFNMLLLSIFAVTALVLGSVGVYGVMSYIVAERTHEIGIRLALGAGSLRVVKLVLRRCLVLTVYGISIGLAAALALTRVMAGLLYDVSPTDAATYVAAALILGAVAVAAAVVPARRATRVDPISALRCD